MLLYMFNMLHMWSWLIDVQPPEIAVGYVLTATYGKRRSQGS